MSAKAGISAARGDIFLVPLGDGTFVPGQVVDSWNDELYLAIYETRVPGGDSAAEAIAGAEPFLAVLSLDAKLWNGDWPIVANRRDNLASIAQPVFRVMQSGAPFVESRDRTLYRPARGDEFAQLQFRSVASPQVVEDAVRARFGLDEWLPGYDRYLYDYAKMSSRVSQ